MNYLVDADITDKKVGLRVDLNVQLKMVKYLIMKGCQQLFQQYFTYLKELKSFAS